MTALKNVLAGGVAAAALITAAPAAAQYYPGYGDPYGGDPYGGSEVGPIGNQVPGGGYGYNNPAVDQCVGAVQQRLNGGYPGYGGNGYNGDRGPYGYGGPDGYGGGRVLGISRVEPRSNGGLTVRGVASSGRYVAYGYGEQSPIDLTFRCKVDYRGFVTDIDIDRAQPSYGNNYSPYDNDYSQYGYRRY
jgi:hypothetical protein